MEIQQQTEVRPVGEWINQMVYQKGHVFGKTGAQSHTNSNLPVTLSETVTVSALPAHGGKELEVFTFPVGAEVVIYRAYRDAPINPSSVATVFLDHEQLTIKTNGRMYRRRL